MTQESSHPADDSEQESLAGQELAGSDGELSELVAELRGAVWQDELHKAIDKRCLLWLFVGMSALADVFMPDKATTALWVRLAYGLGAVLSGAIAYAKPHRNWFAGDALMFGAGCGFFVFITLQGINYWSRWFPFDWFLVIFSGALAGYSFWQFWRLRQAVGNALGAFLGPVSGLLGAALVLADPIIPRPYDNHLAQARVHLEKHELSQAIAELSQAIDLNPKAPQAWYHRGFARKKQGDLQGAIADYTVVIELNPNLAHAYLARALCRLATEEWQGAIADANQAINRSPEPGEAYYVRGVAKIAQGNRAEGNLDLEECFKRRPDLKSKWERRLKTP